MKAPFEFATDDTKTALVIAFPPGVKGLFNSEIHDLVRGVEERLDGVYVTYALNSASSPNLQDAMAAARFVGCEAAVVVPAGASDVVRFVDRETAGDWLLKTAPVVSEIDAAAVVEAYLSAIAEAGRAA